MAFVFQRDIEKTVCESRQIARSAGFRDNQRKEKQATPKVAFVFQRDIEKTVCESRQIARSAGFRDNQRKEKQATPKKRKRYYGP